MLPFSGSSARLGGVLDADAPKRRIIRSTFAEVITSWLSAGMASRSTMSKSHWDSPYWAADASRTGKMTVDAGLGISSWSSVTGEWLEVPDLAIITRS